MQSRGTRSGFSAAHQRLLAWIVWLGALSIFFAAGLLIGGRSQAPVVVALAFMAGGVLGVLLGRAS
ncbi:MAG: hypothetical protein ACR2PL_22190 [Dehalococcoidia bacterium]